MLLDVKFVKSTSMYCTESAVATVAQWLGRNYEMMFSKMWGFKFSYHDSKSAGIIGTNLSAEYTYEDEYEMAEKYHGIKLAGYKSKDSIELLEIIENNLVKRMPILLMINKACCPWTDGNGTAYLLVTGMDNNCLICIDIHYALSGKMLPIENLSFHFELNKCSDRNNYAVFEVVSEGDNNVSLFDFIDNLQNSESLKNRNPFEEMRELAKIIEGGITYGDEYIGNKTPLLDNIVDITRTRMLLSSTLGYIGQKNQDSIAQNIGNDFLLIGGKWTTIASMMHKAFFSKTENIDFFKRLANKINEISYDEENLVSSIAKKHYINKVNNYVLNKKDDLKCISNNIIRYDLNKLFNNRAFASSIDNNHEGADFTGYNEYFLSNGLPEDRNILTASSCFVLSDINNKYDNISCSGQVIYVLSENFHNKIMILGCGEWGNIVSQLKIVYDDDSADIMIIDIPDWFFTGISSTEIAWIGDAKCSNNNIEKRALFSISFMLCQNKKVKQNHLPDCTNFHIFAISFEQNRS
ncbi:MAG: hypothetical protein GX144_00660 [Clostridiaceae bacterium]|nr:hypothetical protein [Clostridiaceae bacterium]